MLFEAFQGLTGTLYPLIMISPLFRTAVGPSIVPTASVSPAQPSAAPPAGWQQDGQAEVLLGGAGHSAVLLAANGAGKTPWVDSCKQTAGWQRTACRC
jgi:hypothetical protein